MLLLVAGAALFAYPPPDVASLVEKGARLNQAGEPDAALKALTSAEPLLANPSPTDSPQHRELTAELHAQLGKAYAAKARNAKPAEARELVELAVRSFRTASVHATNRAKALSQANLAAALRQKAETAFPWTVAKPAPGPMNVAGEPKGFAPVPTPDEASAAERRKIAREAAEAFETCLVAGDHYAPFERFGIAFNAGEAWEVAQEPKKAWRNYCRSLDDNRQFPRTAEALLRLAIAEASGNVELFESRGMELVALGLTQQALELALKGCGLPDSAPGKAAARLRMREAALATALRAWAKAYSGPDLLNDERNRAILTKLEQLGLGAAAAAIRRVGDGDVAVRAEAISRGQHPVLTDAEALLEAPLKSPWSAFACAAANWRLDRADNEGKEEFAAAAMARYILAWGADHGNTQAAKGIAWLLSSRGDRLVGIAALRTRFVQLVIDEKNGIYQQSSKSQASCENLTRMHVLLGNVFEESKEIGDGDEVRSALFQFRRAVATERLVREFKGGQRFSAPEAYEGYARCLSKVGRTAEAHSQWVVAAERNLESGLKDEAKAAANAANALKVAAPEAERTRLNTVLTRLAEPRRKPSGSNVAVPP